jgi:hypothetical protein
MPLHKYPILFLNNVNQAIEYTTKQPGRGSSKYPERNIQSHGTRLIGQFKRLWTDVDHQNKQRVAQALQTKSGHYIEIRGLPEHELKEKSVENISRGIRLLNDRTSELDEAVATIYVPEGKEGYFISKIEKYLEPKNANQKKHNNQDLVNSIQDISLAFIESFWQDNPDLIPTEHPIWCEFWLRTEPQFNVLEIFNETCQQIGIELKEGVINFPERLVVIGRCNKDQLNEFIQIFNYLAELRKAKTALSFIMSENNVDQAEWVEELSQRIAIGDDGTNTAICILDTGINNGHALIGPILDDRDKYTYVQEWGIDDDEGHGTQMAGVAIFGDLQEAIESQNAIGISHKLESGKILPPGAEHNDPELYGFITKQVISYAEIANPNRKRIICMAVSVDTNFDQGRPTSYSGAIDALCSGAEDEERRLILLSSGNTSNALWLTYPESNLVTSVESPGQSWNALTIGAYTEKTNIEEPGLEDFEAIAPAGGLSPFSSTSRTWEDKKWPFKPDIVLEGGNAARNGQGDFASGCYDLSVLTTHYRPANRQFDSFSMSSAATAKGSWMAAQIQIQYPEAWPETIRALLIHSARWTDVMKEQFLIDGSSKANYRNLLRICGYGVPDLDKALYSMSNNLTLVSQSEIQPFHKAEGKPNVTTKDMHFYELPWPEEALLELGDTPVTLRVTISYFIEPGPGEIGWKDRYRYRSHGLKFEINKPAESEEEFAQRVNAAVEGAEGVGGTGANWEIGSQSRNLGSVHSDFVNMTATELAACKYVGIFPVIGWWKERTHLKKYDSVGRYSLIVSIETPSEDIDIHIPVATKLRVPITIL